MGASEDAFQEAIKSMSGGRPTEAAALFSKALALKPDHAEAWLGQGNAFVQLKRYDDAFAAFDRAIALKPALAGAWLGHLLANHGRHDESLAAYDKALMVKPDLAEAWLGRCHSLVKLARYTEALAAYDRALVVQPGLAAAWLGHLLASLERHVDALAAYDKTLAIKADLVEAWLGRGNVLIKLRRLDEALAAHDKVLALKPDFAEAWLGRGNLLTELGRYDQASAAFDRALALKPGLAEAWLGRGHLLAKLNHREQAIAAYNKALALKPGLIQAWLGLANVFAELERHDEALAACDRALALDPGLPEAWLGRGYSLIKSGGHDEALAAYDKALALRPDLTEARIGRGNVFLKRERHEEALAVYDQALAFQPGSAEAWLGRGNALTALDRFEEAFAARDKALALKPDLAEAWLAYGNMLHRQKSVDKALVAYDKALALKPRLAEAWLGRGNLLFELHRLDDALVSHDRALALKPDLAEAWLGRGNVVTAMGRDDQAILDYDRGLALNPDLVGLASLRLRSKQNICDWKDFDSDCNQLLDSVAKNQLAVEPFILLSLASSPRDQFNYARNWIGKRHPPTKPPLWNGEIYQHDKIRIGYVSADFQEHATAYLLAGVFENHDRSSFDITAISIGPADGSPMRRRLISAFDRFIEAGALGDVEVAKQIRSAEIDILVDLKGFTKASRPNIFACRAAPIQVNYLGYPGTMGADYIDYIIADPTVIPFSAQGDYAESVVYLPNTYQANDSRRSISGTTLAREDCGLPRNGFVFCCFNNNYKLTPEMFDRWMQILSKVPDSVLWLFENNVTASTNLKKQAGLRGVRAERIIFAPHMPLPDHLARHHLADLFLDTSPYNAHTTASDALWAGLPILTQIGETFAARVAASLLNAVGLPELITHNPDEYEQRAIGIANDPEALSAIKKKLAENRLHKPLFDTKLITRQIEAGYFAMYTRYQAGLAPETIVVSD